MSEQSHYDPRPSSNDLDCMEGKRLRRLGIDPDGDPLEIMAALDHLRKAQRERSEVDTPTIVELPSTKE